jgi:hypothetical protein
MPLDEKSRLKLDKVFMAFGSCMKAVNPEFMNDQTLQAYADVAWAWSIRKVSALVDTLYQEPEKAETKPPPAAPTPSQEPLGETETITVKAVALQSQGVSKQGRPWKVYKVTDDYETNYYTFHTSFQIGETYEVDWVWYEKDGKRSRSIKEPPRPVGRDPRYATRAERDDDDDSDVPF